MEKLKLFFKAVYAGFMIGIGGTIYLSVENRVIGSLLFSFGLLTIVTQGFALYTGRIGFVREIKQLPDMAVIAAGNYLGTFLTAAVLKAAGLPVDAAALAQKKLENGPVHIFFLSVLCGVMMYLAIDNYNKSKNLVFVSLPVMIFILAGFEHSVADMFYFHLAGAYSPQAFFYLLLMILGNGIGAKVFDFKNMLTDSGSAE